uniref:F54D1.6-like Ig-like domain-containing protein n=1 Tax=Parascaris equorum TaxID=6256 RepID=A0A914RZT2_PAREQ
MLGQMTVDVNGMCLDPSTTYVLMIEQRETAPCDVLNAAVARILASKNVLKTFYAIKEIFSVPPTIDPMRLDIGNIHDWFRNPVKDDKEIV